MDATELDLVEAFGNAVRYTQEAKAFDRLMLNEPEPTGDRSQELHDQANAFTLRMAPYWPTITAFHRLKLQRAVFELRRRYPELYEEVKRDPERWLVEEGDDA